MKTIISTRSLILLIITSFEFRSVAISVSKCFVTAFVAKNIIHIVTYHIVGEIHLGALDQEAHLSRQERNFIVLGFELLQVGQTAHRVRQLLQLVSGQVQSILEYN